MRVRRSKYSLLLLFVLNISSVLNDQFVFNFPGICVDRQWCPKRSVCFNFPSVDAGYHCGVPNDQHALLFGARIVDFVVGSFLVET